MGGFFLHIMNKSDVRAVIERDDPELVSDLIRWADALRLTGNIKAAADIKLQLLKIAMDDEAIEDDAVVFTVVRRNAGTK